MSYTLNDALLALARYVLPKHAGVATSGTTNTLTDATFVQANDQFNSGVIFFRSGSFANQYAVITNYASPGGGFSFVDIGAPGISAGNQYEAVALHSGMNLYDMISAINQALAVCGDVMQENTALTTVNGQESYDLPSGVYNVKKVEIARNTTTPYRWMQSTHWHEINDDIRFESQFAYFGDSYVIRLTYLAPHDTLTDYDDVINQQVNPEWLKYTACINLMRSMANRGKNWSDMKAQYEEAQEKVVTMRPLRGIIVTVRGS